MSYNGSGTFNINTTGQPVVAGTIISSASFNALTADLATGLTTAITKDGQTTATARIPFAQGITSTLVTDASSTTTGSIITAGGVGIAKKLYVGTDANIAGTLTYGGVTLTNGVTGTGKMVLDTAPTIASANLTTALTLAGAAGTNGQVLTSSGSGLPSWTTIAQSATIVRSPRTSNTILGTADSSTLIDITSGTFSQTFTAAATLGSGWFCYIHNSGTGYVTLDPNGSETITRNGVAFTTWVLWPQEAALIVCNGTGFFYINLQKGSAVQTISSNVTSLVFSTGLAYRQQMRLSWSRVGVDANTQIKLYLNTSTLPDKNSLITVNGTSVSANGAGGTGDNFTLGTGTAAANTGAELMRGYFDFILNQNTVSSFGPQQYKTTTTSLYGLVAQVWNGISESTITNITIEVGSPNNFNAGTFTLTEL